MGDILDMTGTISQSPLKKILAAASSLRRQSVIDELASLLVVKGHDADAIDLNITRGTG
jgi:hypothetical protein